MKNKVHIKKTVSNTIMRKSILSVLVAFSIIGILMISPVSAGWFDWLFPGEKGKQTPLVEEESIVSSNDPFHPSGKDNVKLPGKPDNLADGEEKEYLNKKFKKQGNYIIHSQQTHLPEIFPVGHINHGKHKLRACAEVENTATGQFTSICGSAFVTGYSSGSFDIDLSDSDWVVWKSYKGTPPAMTWEYSTSYSNITEIIIASVDDGNGTKHEVEQQVPSRAYSNYQAISNLNTFKTSQFGGVNLVLDPDVGCGANLATPGTYNLNQSLQCNGTVFTISANDTVFDGNGFTITGNYTTSNFVFVLNTGTELRNITIRNLTVTLVDRLVSGTSTNINRNSFLIENTRVINTSGIAIGIGNLTNSIVRNNYFENLGGNGINFLAGSQNNLVLNNTINTIRSGRGFTNVAIESRNNRIINNTFRNMSNEGILIGNAINETIIGNIIIFPGQEGIDLQSGTNDTIVMDNIIKDTPSTIGIIVQAGSNNTLIWGNNLSNITGGAINVVGFNNISRNQVWGTNNYGIVVAGSDNFLFENNISNGTVGGILLQTSAARTIVRGNRIFEGSVGIQTSGVGVQNNTLEFNIITKTPTSAIIDSSLSRGNIWQYNNVTTALRCIDFTAGSTYSIARNNVCTNITTDNIRVNLGANNSVFIDNDVMNGIRSSVTVGYNNAFIDTATNAYINVTDGTGVVIINLSNTFYSVGSTSATLNNVSLYQLNNALIHNNTRVCIGTASTNVNSNDGNVNLTNFGGTTNTCYVLNNYNVTEGATARGNDPLRFTSSTYTAKTLNSSLLQTINVTSLLSINQLQYLTAITLDGVSQTYTLNSINTTATIATSQIDTGSNLYLLSYVYVDPATCSTLLTSFASYPVLIGLVGTVFLLGLAIIIMFGYASFKNGVEITKESVIGFFVIIIGIALLVIVGIIAVGSICALG